MQIQGEKDYLLLFEYEVGKGTPVWGSFDTTEL